MGSAEQAMFEEVRLAELRAKARLREVQDDKALQAAIDRWQARTGQSFHRYAAERLTSDKEHPVGESTVYDWLARRNGRRPPDCLTGILFEEDDEYNAWKNQRAGFDPPRRSLPVEGVALAHALESKLRGFGEVGQRAIGEARREAAQRNAPEWERTTPTLVTTPTRSAR